MLLFRVRSLILDRDGDGDGDDFKRDGDDIGDEDDDSDRSGDLRLAMSLTIEAEVGTVLDFLDMDRLCLVDGGECITANGDEWSAFIFLFVY